MSGQPSLVETRLLTMEISCMPQFIPVASQVNESTSAELKTQNEQEVNVQSVEKISYLNEWPLVIAHVSSTNKTFIYRNWLL